MIKGPFKINGNLILTLDDLQKHFDIIEILKKPKGLIRFLEETAPEKACKVKEIEFFPTYEFVDKITIWRSGSIARKDLERCRSCWLTHCHAVFRRSNEYKRETNRSRNFCNSSVDWNRPHSKRLIKRTR